MNKKLITLLSLTTAFFANLGHAAGMERVLCVWDPIGKAGPIATQMEDLKLAAVSWGVKLEVKVLSDERVVAEQLKAGQCDAGGMTGMRAREFNSFTGTLDSLGSIPSYEHAKIVLRYLSDPKMSKLMVAGDYEVAGVTPLGSAYLFTNDRTVDTVSEMAGKKVAAMDFDKAQAIMIESVGASPVTVSITNFGAMFNNGSVDIIGAPALAYEVFELYKGLGDNGAVVNFSMLQVTGQIVLRQDRFPEGFGQKSREFVFGQFDKAMKTIKVATDSIDDKYWMDLPSKDKEGYSEMFRQARLKMRSENLYNGKMLSFLSKVRCQKDPSLAECTAKDRE